MTPCELWLDACALHQRTTFLSLQTSNLLNLVANESLLSSTLCREAWTSATLSAHLSTETPICAHCTTAHLITTSDVRHSGRINDGMQSGWTTLWDSALSIPTSASILLEWPFQKQRWFNLIASILVLHVSTLACTNGVWPHLRPVSAVQKNKPSTLLYSNVQSIDLLTDCTAWWFWMMRQLNGCSTPAPRSSAAKQWLKDLAQTMTSVDQVCSATPWKIYFASS